MSSATKSKIASIAKASRVALPRVSFAASSRTWASGSRPRTASPPGAEGAPVLQRREDDRRHHLAGGRREGLVRYGRRVVPHEAPRRPPSSFVASVRLAVDHVGEDGAVNWRLHVAHVVADRESREPSGVVEAYERGIAPTSDRSRGPRSERHLHDVAGGSSFDAEPAVVAGLSTGNAVPPAARWTCART